MSLAWWRWRRGGGKPFDVSENRRDLIRRLAPGKSFLDVGGMFHVAGEASFLAEQAGATKVVLLDGMDPSEEFQAKHAARSSTVRYVQGDLHDSGLVEELGVFDVVLCGGVIYHSPNPYLQLEHLRRLTGEHLLLGTHLIPEVPGIPNACIFYPDMPSAAREAFARVHRERRPENPLVGLTTPFDRTPMTGYVNFWWGMTLSALRAMLGVARFEVVEEFTLSPLFADVLARPIGGESLIPPPELLRELGEARRAGFPEGSTPAWAESP